MRRSRSVALAVALLAAIPARAAKTPQELADALVEQAKTEVTAGRLDAAEYALEKALKKVPGHGGALYLLCSVQIGGADRAGRGFASRADVTAGYRRAASTCARGAEANAGSERRSMQLLRLRALFEARAWDEAATLFAALVAESPEDGRLVGGYAAMLDRCERAGESRAALEGAAARGPAFDRDARFEFVWDRFDPADAERLGRMIAELRGVEDDPRRSAILDVMSAALENRRPAAMLAFLQLVERGGVNRQELSRLWSTISGSQPDDDGPPAVARVPWEEQGVTLPTLVRKIAPSFPETLRANRQPGRVLLLARVNDDGTVGPVWPIRSTHEDFEVAAVQAIRRWEYTPATQDGKPIALPYTIRVDFRFR